MYAHFFSLKAFLILSRIRSPEQETCFSVIPVILPSAASQPGNFLTQKQQDSDGRTDSI